MPIVAQEASVGPNPHIALLILDDMINGIAGKTVFYGKMLQYRSLCQEPCSKTVAYHKSNKKANQVHHCKWMIAQNEEKINIDEKEMISDAF